MKRIVRGAVVGVVVGVLVAGLWWMRLDRQVCAGGCAAGRPAGDLTLAVGALMGTAAALLVRVLRAAWRHGTTRSLGDEA